MKMSEQMKTQVQTQTGLEIAVIGMAGRFPGARDIHEFWSNLKEGVESISFFTEEEMQQAGVAQDPNYVGAYGVLDGIEYFDAAFFGYSPREAEIMDPQIRIFHECAWEALESAGYDPGKYSGLIGLYAGASPNFFWEVRAVLSGKTNEVGRFTANHLTRKDYLSLRVSYKLGLSGPSFVLHTTCSTSLVAIHLGCQAILNGECDMALAGGITVLNLNRRGYIYQEGMVNSADGHCRAFDEAATGLVGGDGVGVVVLKRLEDAALDGDNIYAVVKGSAVNNDGLRKAGFAAPSIEGQAEVIKMAQQMAGVSPGSIGCIEAHGTATELGDPVEIEGLKLAFDSDKKGFCAIGGVKSNVGHLDSAAGVAGFIKAVLALKYRLIPPTANFDTPNLKIDFINSPFYVNVRLTAWENGSTPRRAGVSSFGIGGTNAHVILEEAPELAASTTASPSRPCQLLLLSARTESALAKASENLVEYLRAHPFVNLADAAYTLQVGRREFPYRRMLVCAGIEEAAAALSSPKPGQVHSMTAKVENRPIVFVFSGQAPGEPAVHMALALYQCEPGFRAEVEGCLDILNPQDRPADPAAIFNHTSVEGIFMFEFALARLLMNWGIKPYTMIGDGWGEYIAACLSGVLSLPDALRLALARQMGEGESAAGGIRLNKPQIPFLSNVTGDWIKYEEAADPAYWQSHSSANSRFAQGMERLSKLEHAVLLLFHPGTSASASGSQAVPLVGDSGPDEPAFHSWLRKVGLLWLHGLSIDWSGFYAGEKRYRLPLPTYPFERQRYWIEEEQLKNQDWPTADRYSSPGAVDLKKDTAEEKSYRRPELSTEYMAPRDETEQRLAALWQEFFGFDQIGIQDDFFELGGDSLEAITLVPRIHKELDVNLSMIEFFNNPTVEGVAGYIKKSTGESFAGIQPVEKREYYTLSSAQKRLFALSKIEGDGATSYNVSKVILIKGELDRQQLAENFKQLIERHELLRTSFMIADDTAVQVIHPRVEFNVGFSECSEEKIEEKIDTFIRPFHLDRAPLLRVGLLKVSAEKQLLMVGMHHIIADGIAVGILIEEFMTLSAGRGLPPQKVQYKDYSEWQNKHLGSERLKRQEEYWSNRFAGNITVLDLPTDFPRPVVRSTSGDIIIIELEKDLTRKLRSLCSETDTTLYMVLLASYNVLLSKYTMQEEIIVGSPISGRNHVDVQKMIGTFANMLAMKNQPQKDKKWVDFLREVKENALNAYENQDYQFEELVTGLGIKADPGRNPLFDVVLNVMSTGTQEQKIESDEVVMTPNEYEYSSSKYDLLLRVFDADDRAYMSLEYAVALFKRSTVENIIAHYLEILNQVVENKEAELGDITIPCEFLLARNVGKEENVGFNF